jgi:hypothetical protein
MQTDTLIVIEELRRSSAALEHAAMKLEKEENADNAINAHECAMYQAEMLQEVARIAGRNANQLNKLNRVGSQPRDYASIQAQTA